MSLEFIQPQLATSVNHPPPRAGWIHEVKHDGYRTLLIIERRKARAYTRNGFDWTERYSGITKGAAKLDGRSAIIDGEVIVQDERGVSDFEGLKSAIRWRPQSLVFCAFDLLHLNGKDFRERPLLERRAKLRELVPSGHTRFCSVRNSPGMVLRSFKPARITNLRASFPNSHLRNIAVGAVRRGLRRSALPKARLSSSEPRVIERRKLLWPCWLGPIRRGWHTRAQASSSSPRSKELN